MEVLLRARDSVSQVAQKVVKSLDDVTAAQKRNDQASKNAAEHTQRYITALEQLREARIREKGVLEEVIPIRKKETAALKEQANQARRRMEDLRTTASLERKISAERESRDLQAITSLRREVAEREASTGKKTKAFNAETAQMKKDVALMRAVAADESAINKQRADDINLQIGNSQKLTNERVRAASDAQDALSKSKTKLVEATKGIKDNERELSSLSSANNETSRSTGRLGRFFDGLNTHTNNARSGLKGLNAEFQGFQIALVIKYAQALISVLVGLAGQLVAVAAAAGQAAVGLGAALAAGMAQAIPVVGVLAAAFSRLTSVLKIVKLHNQQQLTATHDATRAAKSQQAATDQIRSAEQRVADAHRNTQQAVEDLTKARKDGIRTVQDLMAAEQDAVQSLLQSQQSRQRAIESGDVMGAVQGNIDVSRARRGVTRARQDVAPVRARGVEGLDAVQQAEKRVTDARRSESQANQDLARTRRQAADQVAQETAAVDKLTDSLKQLSPAEQNLYRRILVLQGTYKRIARPITDIITRAFTDVVDRVNQLLQDPKIVRGFRNIAVQIAASIRSATSEAGGRRSVGAFQILSAEAARNIPIATRILLNFFRVVRNLVIDAIPAFRLLLGYVEDYSNKAKDASGNSKGISDFFITGVRYAKSFFDLGLAVINLFLTLAGSGGAAGEGNRTIKDLTKLVDGLTEKVRKNAGKIREFFSQAHDVFFDVLSVVGTLAGAIFDAFSPKSVSTFADFLNRVIIPALGNVVEGMGFLVTAFHEVFSLPGVSQAAQLAATVLGFAAGLTVIRKAMASIAEILPKFLGAMGLLAEGGAIATGGWIVLAVLAAAAAVVMLDKKLHFLGPTWKWIKHAASDAFDWIKTAAQDVVSWFSDVWTQGLLYWIRWPFVWMAKHVSIPIFQWLFNAAKDAIGWLKKTFGPDGDFAVIGDLIAAPFRLAWHAVKFSFSIIKTIILGALDLIAGRFDKFGDLMGDFWAGFIDVGRGAISSLLGIVGELMGALGKIPKIGGPFKEAAKDILAAQQNIDGLRESTKSQRKEQKHSDDVIKEHIPTLVRLRNRYEDAKERLSKLTPGTKRYRDAVKEAHDASKPYNAALKDTASKAGNARQPVSRLRGNIKNLGDVSSDTADAIANDLNSVLAGLGEKKLNLRIKRTKRRSSAQNLMDSDNPLLGSPFPRYAGGFASPYGGSSRDDHMLIDPSGRAVAAMSGTEGVINAPQMGVINNALSFTQQMAGTPWGSLNDLWGSGMRHYAGGGGLHPAIASVSNRLDKMFDLQTTSTTGGQHAANSYHKRGLAADISGSSENMARASKYIKMSGLARSLLEGIHNPGLSIKNGQSVPPGFWGADTWANHVNHIHLALQSLSGHLAGAIARVRTPQISGLGSDSLSRIARAGARKLTRAANRYLSRQVTRMGGGDTDLRGLGRGVSGSNQQMGRRMMLRGGWGGGEWPPLKALWTGESNWDETARNASSGAGGIPQALPASKMGPGAIGRGAAVARKQIAWGLGYIKDRYGSPSAAYAAWKSRSPHWYNGGGSLRGTVGTPRVVAPRSSSRSSALSVENLIGRSLRPVMDTIAGLFSGIATALEATARGPLRRSKNLTLRIQRAFSRITGDGGLLDQMRTQIETITARGALALQRRQFRVTRHGPVRVALTEAQVARGELQGLQGQRGALQDERGAITDSIGGAQRSLKVARRRHDSKAADAARAAIVNLRGRLDTNATALAQNAQDQVEAQERFQQAMLSAVNDAADRQNGAVDRWSRMAKALGQNLDPNAVLGSQIQNMQTQIGGLQGVLAQARKTGNTELANQVSDQIAELNVQIAEAAAQQFQNAIDAVNNAAQKRTTQLDRATRIAQLGGKTNFAAMQGILGQRGDVLTNQRSGLLGLLAQAQASGNTEQVDNLVDQIDELNVQIAENTQATQDNTDAAFDFTTSMINEAASFSQGVFGGAQGFFQALTEHTGINTIPQQLAALTGIATSLHTQQTGLASQLAALTGDNSVLGLSGAGLVGYLTSISSGPAFAAIMAKLDPTQQTAFKDLITALIGNATATEQNTQAIDQMTNPGAQSFASTLWSTFRTAVFTGDGGLLPKYQMTVPHANVGAKILASGMLVAHAGETIRPASVSRDWDGAGGDTYQLNLTTPTEVLNPTDVARQLAFYRKSQGRR